MSDRFIRDNLVDADDQKVKVGDVAPDGVVWVRLAAARIPARRNVNGNLMFVAADVRAALHVAGRELHPSA